MGGSLCQKVLGTLKSDWQVFGAPGRPSARIEGPKAMPYIADVGGDRL